MFGFDMMLGSYYDNYVINYVSFEEWTPTEEVFVMPQGKFVFEMSFWGRFGLMHTNFYKFLILIDLIDWREGFNTAF